MRPGARRGVHTQHRPPLLPRLPGQLARDLVHDDAQQRAHAVEVRRRHRQVHCHRGAGDGAVEAGPVRRPSGVRQQDAQGFPGRGPDRGRAAGRGAEVRPQRTPPAVAD